VINGQTLKFQSHRSGSELEKLFIKEPEIKYFRLCEPKGKNEDIIWILYCLKHSHLLWVELCPPRGDVLRY
jgi:hypothetical protein